MAATGGGGGGAAGAAGAACAACKYQRRRCTPDCPLAKYFPNDRPRVFRNAHRLFGVSNILKTLNRVGSDDPEKRHEAMQCIVYESQAWDVYPDSGCVPIILDLQRRIRQAENELRRVNADVQACRRRRYSAAAAAAAAGGGGQRPLILHDDDGIIAAAAAHQAPYGGVAAAVDAPLFIYDGGGGGGGGERQEQMLMMDTSDDGDNNDIAAEQQTLQPWMMVPQPPQYERTQLPQLQDDTMNYFAEDG